jgi:hypothetical protein
MGRTQPAVSGWAGWRPSRCAGAEDLSVPACSFVPGVTGQAPVCQRRQAW